MNWYVNVIVAVLPLLTVQLLNWTKEWGLSVKVIGR